MFRTMMGLVLAACCLTGCRTSTSHRTPCCAPAPVAACPAPAPCCPTPGVIPPPPPIR